MPSCACSFLRGALAILRQVVFYNLALEAAKTARVKLSDAKEQLASSYCEVPIFAKAGTCVMYDTELFHCRWDGETTAHRRTMQEYFYREDRPSGTLKK